MNNKDVEMGWQKWLAMFLPHHSSGQLTLTPQTREEQPAFFFFLLSLLGNRMFPSVSRAAICYRVLTLFNESYAICEVARWFGPPAFAARARTLSNW